MYSVYECVCVCVYTYIYIYVCIYIYRCRLSSVNLHSFKSIFFDEVDALALVFSSASTLRYNTFVSAAKEPEQTSWVSG